MQSDFFSNNRKVLSKELRGGVIVLAASSSMQRKHDAAYAFEQESSFWYLTGIEEPDWQLIIDGQRGRSVLVAPEVSEQKQAFDGSLPWDEAKAKSGVDDVISKDDADAWLRELAKKHSMVYALGDDPHARYYDFVLNPAQRKLWQKLERIFPDVVDCRPDLAKMRAIKQPDEIAAIKKAVKLTAQAFSDVKAKLGSLRYEYEVEAEFDYQFRRHNAGHAYDPIIAAGAHACTLHYVKNDSRLLARQAVLLDIGARVDGYAADITRTYARGEPTKRLREVHSAVEQAHNDIIALLKPEYSVKSYQQEVEVIMRRTLAGLGLMDEADDIKFRRYFPHAVSHGLGIDVHDSLGAPEFFRENMVLTVEPGIYIPEEGIGVRIEDDILITASGHENLSASLSTGL